METRSKKPIAVILAGGKGKRLRPITETLPKPLVPVAGVPAMTHILRLLRRCGYTEAIVTVCFEKEKIKRYYGTQAEGIHLIYAEETVPLGTAGGVAAAVTDTERDVLVISGDAVCDFDLTEVYHRHKKADADATLVLSSKEDPSQFGVVLTDRDGFIRGFSEKPSEDTAFSDTVNTGIYFLSPRILRMIPWESASDFGHDLFPAALREGYRLLGVEDKGYWCDIGTLDAYYACCMDAVGGKIPHLTFPGDAAAIPGCVIGKNVKVEPGAVVRHSILLGSNEIKAGSQIEHAILCEDVRVGFDCTVGSGCVIGSHSVIEDGMILPGGQKIRERTLVRAFTERFEDGGSSNAKAENGRSPANPYAPAARSTVPAVTTSPDGADFSDNDETPESNHAADRFYFDGLLAVADRFDGDGVFLAADSPCPDAVFCAKLAQAATYAAQGRRIGIMYDATQHAENAARILCGAVGTAGGKCILFGQGGRWLAAFAGCSFSCALCFAVTEKNGIPYAYLTDEFGLYPSRFTERKLETALSDTDEIKADAVFPHEEAGGIDALLDARLSQYHIFPCGIPGDAVRWSLDGEENVKELLTLTSAFGSLPHPDGGVTFSLDEDGYLLAKEKDVTVDRFTQCAIFLANGCFDGQEMIALPPTAPLWLSEAVQKAGHRPVTLSHCPAEGDACLLARRTAREQPMLHNPLFSAAALVSLMKRERKSLAELAEGHDAVRAYTEFEVPRGRKQKILRRFAQMREPGEEVRTEFVTVTKPGGTVSLSPTRREALRIFADAATAEAAEELLIDIKKEIERTLK